MAKVFKQGKMQEVKKAPWPKMTMAVRRLVESETHDAYDAGYKHGYKIGGEVTEQAKAGGILDLQQQLDAAQREVVKLKAFRKSIINMIAGQLK